MSSSPVRIMYLDTCTDLAGGQHSLLTLMKRLDRSRYVPSLFAPSGSRLKQLCGELGIETHTLPFRSVHMVSHAKPAWIAWPEDLFRSLIGVFLLTWAMRRKRVDVVHANTFKAALVGSIACVLAGKPLVFHDRITIGHGILERMVARLARRIVVVSSALAEKHGEALRGKVTLVYDSVDTGYMSPERASSGADGSGSRTVCYLGRISWEKGVDRLIEAAGAVVSRRPGTRFLIGGSPYTPGDAKYNHDLLRIVDRLHLVNSVHLEGHISDSRAFLMKADVFVLPSRRESLGMVLLEAMALEKPVVAFAVDGPREIITDNKDGLLIEPGDIEGLAGAIIAVLDNRDMALRIGKMGRQTVMSRFSVETFVNRISQIYDEIAGLPAAADADAR